MDKDLEFLTLCSNEELEFLFQILTTKGSLSEFITCSEAYREYGNNYRQYVDLLVKEVLDFGSNTFWFQEDYHTVAKDACKKLGVSCNSSDSTEEIELKVLSHIIDKAWDKLPENDKKAFIDSCGYSGGGTHTIIKGVGPGLFFTLFRQAGFESYKMSVIIANALSRQIFNRGLPFAANAALTKWLAIFTGPVGWALTAGWTMLDIAGPAYRVTIPAVAYIGCLRSIKKYQGKG